jgi:hypothetical protein
VLVFAFLCKLKGCFFFSTRVEFADVLSVLAMTMAHGKGESLAFKLKGNPTALDEWGHE